ncbi:MAG: hypothetical protein Q4F05_11250 [bacterium]|nr:hypothetical protein [bacterium]
MHFPCLIKKEFCKTDTVVEIEQEGVDKYGDPLDSFIYEGKCNYQDSAKTVLTAEKKLIQLSGVALFIGDIAPDIPVISGGTITVHGEERQIYQGRKCRNPDETVNYTEIQVM